MFPLTPIFSMVIQETVILLKNPLFWIVVAIIAFQYKRMARAKALFFGTNRENYWRPTLQATFFGIVGGVLGSLLMVLVGISVTDIGLNYIWPIAIILMLLSPHFLCFAYAGGLLSLSYLFFGFPQINIPQILGLVAVLHLVESILIFGSGHLGAVPVFVKNGAGQLVGGFTLQRFWPIPIVLLILPGTTDLAMPGWWPLINFNLHGLESNLLPPLMGVAAGLGYGDIALTRTPREKSRISAIYLSGYSLILLFLALLAARTPLFAYIAAFFAPLGHEAIIRIGQRSELLGEPMFVPPGKGLKVLDVQTGSPAARAGIALGDVIHVINGEVVSDRFDLERVLWKSPIRLELEFTHGVFPRRIRRRVYLKRGESLGIIPVPDGYEEVYMEVKTRGFLGNLWHKIVKKIKGAGD